MSAIVRKACMWSLLAFLISWQISFATDAKDIRKHQGEVVYDDGKFGLIRVPVGKNNLTKRKAAGKSSSGNNKQNVARPQKPGIPSFVKPGSGPSGKQGISPNYVDTDYSSDWETNNTISVYASYTSYTGSQSRGGDTYWPTLPGNRVYVYASFHSDVETTVNIEWWVGRYDEEGNELWDYAAWDFNGEMLDPNYWYFAWYHPENSYSSGYCHAWTKVTDQNNSGEYCYFDNEEDWICETQNYYDYGYCEFRVND